MTNRTRRIQSLERALLSVNIESEVDRYIASDDVQAQITEAAERYNVDRDLLATEMRDHEIRIRQIGWNAYYQETAAALGLPLETVTDPVAVEEMIDQLEEENAAHWQKIRSNQSYWRSGIEYRGGKRVTPA